jgi:hypothetical protein
LFGSERVAAASMPGELFGKWCAGQWISVTANGFKGSGDSEEYKCDLEHIEEIENYNANGTWKAAFTCSGEFGTIKLNTLIALQMLKDTPYLAMANTLDFQDSKKASVPPLIVYAKCD